MGTGVALAVRPPGKVLEAGDWKLDARADEPVARLNPGKALQLKEAN
jgi:hypothetical protein